MTMQNDPAVARLQQEESKGGMLDLSIGLPDQETPQDIVDAARRRLAEGATRYTAKPGLPELREKLTNDIATASGQKALVDDLVVTIGASEAVALALMTGASREAGILIPDPGWPNYRLLSDSFALPKTFYRQGDSDSFFADLDEIESGLRKGCKLLVINSPSNPTGSIASATALQDVAELLDKYDAYALSDEAYESITFSGIRAPSIYTYVPQRTFVARTFSKNWSMTGFRVGSLLAPSVFHETVATLHGTITGCAATSMQDAALHALENHPDLGQKMGMIYRRRFERAKEQMGTWLAHGKVEDLGGIYLWLDGRSSGLTSDAMYNGLKSHGVLGSHGSVYSSIDGFVRLSLGASEEDLPKALETTATVLNSLASQA